MQLSARNVLKGRVVKVVIGAVNAEVTLELPRGQQLTYIFTIASAERLGLSEGKQAYGVIKASNIMVAVD